MKRLLVEDFGKVSREFNNIVAFDVLTRDAIARHLEKADIFPSSKNINIFIKALPVTMYSGMPEEKHLQMAMGKSFSRLVTINLMLCCFQLHL